MAERTAYIVTHEAFELRGRAFARVRRDTREPRAGACRRALALTHIRPTHFRFSLEVHVIVVRVVVMRRDHDLEQLLIDGVADQAAQQA